MKSRGGTEASSRRLLSLGRLSIVRCGFINSPLWCLCSLLFCVGFLSPIVGCAERAVQVYYFRDCNNSTQFSSN